ncbi:MAG: epoxyqueuosine reductase [Spirochaetales bacterium]|nr:epoxyqueuosine reductase [Spirochaetales bacterium]
MKVLSLQIKEIALQGGAHLAGITSVERLADSPPSGNAETLMPGARSVISFAIALDKNRTTSFLEKRDWKSHCIDRKATVQRLYSIGDILVQSLESLGYRAVNVNINNNYLPEKGAADITEMTEFHPEFSHRYAGVAAGLGRLGWSGNLMTPEYGALVELGSVITDAVLDEDPLCEQNPCDGCKMCATVCPVGMIHPGESQTVRIAGITETISRKQPNTCCWIGCTGYEGLSTRGDWSNWSPYRLAAPLPENKPELDALCISLQKSDPQMQDGDNAFEDYRKTVFDPEWLYYTVCGFCRSVCMKDRTERLENRKSIHHSGTAALAPDGHHVKAGKNSIKVSTSFGLEVVINPSDFTDINRILPSRGKNPLDREVLRELREYRSADKEFQELT